MARSPRRHAPAGRGAGGSPAERRAGDGGAGRPPVRPRRRLRWRCASRRGAGPTRPTTTSPRSWPPTPTRRDLRVVTSDARARASGCARTAPRWRAPARSAAARRVGSDADPRYRTALLDWLACAARGARGARRARRRVLGRPGGRGGHGGARARLRRHLPARHRAPERADGAGGAGAGAEPVGEALDAYAAGFEAMGALARASHPALYDRGWHPTAVCGGVGAAVAAGRLLGLDAEAQRSAVALALLGAGGLRAAFGSDGKALQVGWAAAAGVRAARLAAAGARAARGGGARVLPRPPAGDTRSPARPRARDRAQLDQGLAVLPADARLDRGRRRLAREAAPSRRPWWCTRCRCRRRGGPDAADGLQAKFSIPYLIAYTLLHGSPTSRASRAWTPRRRGAPRRSRCAPTAGCSSPRRAARRRPARSWRASRRRWARRERPLDAAGLERKVSGLVGDRLAGALDDPERPAAEVLALAGLRA